MLRNKPLGREEVAGFEGFDDREDFEDLVLEEGEIVDVEEFEEAMAIVSK